MLYLAIPLKFQNQVKAVLRTSMYVQDIDKFLISLKSNTINLGLLLLLLALIIAMLLARSFSKPIKQITEASKLVARGEFETKVFIDRKDELKILADNFNEMTSKLMMFFKETKLQRLRLQNILDSINVSLIVVNQEEKITLINRTFQSTFGQLEAKGKHYWEIIKKNQLSDYLTDVREKKHPGSIEIQIDERFFLCSAAMVLEEEEIALVLYDISELKKIETWKKDLVSNVSHELKTPLTSIKGFTDTLLEEINQKQHREFLEIIKRNNERLINIVNDLLLLSRIERNEGKPELKKTDLKKVVVGSLKIFQTELKEKNLSFELIEEGKKFIIKGDPYQLEQVIINLMSNAINYTEKGKIEILDHLSARGSFQ
jgi:two-component system phosphate regulon sensor histidine kinase PhoR